MANEVIVANQGDLLATHIMARRLEMLLHQKPYMKRLCRFVGDTRASGSTSIKQGQMDDDDIGESVAENVAITGQTAVTDGSYTLTPARIAIKRRVSDLIQGIDATGRLNGAALANYNFNAVQRGFDALVCAAIASLTGTVGATGTDMSSDDFFAAQQTLVERNVEGQLAVLLHPRQWTDLQTDLRGEAGPWQYNDEVQAAIRNSSGANLKGTLNGIQIWTSTQVADANAGADHDGGMFMIPEESTLDAVSGKFDGDGAFGFAEGSPEPVTLIPGTRVMAPGGVVYSTLTADADTANQDIVTNYFASVAVADAAKGVKIRTDHA
jgi:hypothetical protein